MEISEITDSKGYDELAPHILQSWRWGEFKARTAGVKKVIRLGIWEGGKLKKIWQIFFHKIPKIPHTIAYLPRGYTPSKSQLSEIRAFCLSERALFLKIDPAMGETRRELLGKTLPSEPIQPRHTIYIDIAPSEKELLSAMHEKTRYNIRLSQRKGVEVRKETGPEAVETFLQVLRETEKRQRFYAHNPTYYRELWSDLEPAKMAFILNAYHPDGKTPIGSIMLFKFKDFLYYPYGGFLYGHRALMAPQLLHWEAIKLGKKLGCKTYDLWGSYKHSPSPSDPWWGFYRLKSGFGGHEVDFPETFDVPLSPLYPAYNFANLFRWRFLRLKTFLGR